MAGHSQARVGGGHGARMLPVAKHLATPDLQNTGCLTEVCHTVQPRRGQMSCGVGGQHAAGCRQLPCRLPCFCSKHCDVAVTDGMLHKQQVLSSKNRAAA
jgi:hypothetical protein